MAALRAWFETVQNRGEERAAPRRKLNIAVQGTTRGAAAKVLIHNLSTTGMLVETSAELSVGDAFDVEIPHAGTTPAVVIWSSGDLFGCEFAAPVSTAAISAALLQTPPQRSTVIPLTDVIPRKHREDYIEEAEPKLLPKLKLRTKALIIVGYCLVSWALIILAAIRLL